MKRIKNNESGQAIAELTIGLMVIMVVLVGVIFISLVGSENIRTVISARENAELQSGTSSNSKYISTWDYGEDNIPFTSDDQETLASFEYQQTYSDLLQNDGFDLKTDNYTTEAQFVKPFTSPDSESLFTNAVDLIAYQGNQDNVQNTIDELNLKNALQKIFNINGNIDLSSQESNKVYMPISKDYTLGK